MSDKNYYKATEKTLYSFSALKMSLERLKIELDYKIAEKEKIESEIDDYNISAATTGKVLGNDISSSVENKVIKIDSLKRYLPKLEVEIMLKESRFKKEELKVSAISEAINTLDLREREIITEYYVNNRSIREISKKINMAQSPIFKTKKAAVKKISINLFGIDALDEQINKLIEEKEDKNEIKKG